mgnify:CR=1 FL=1
MHINLSVKLASTRRFWVCLHGSVNRKVLWAGATKSCKGTHELLRRTYPLNIMIQDVIGNNKYEKFYMVDGNRAYLEIDGKPVDSYVPQKLPEYGIR